MNFLITGASGQLGREWVQFLSENNLPFKAFPSGELDITDSVKVDQKLNEIKPDVVINCAAYTNVDGAETESKKAFLVNEQGVRNLVNACESVGAKLIHYSTDYVFPGSEEDQKKYPNGYPEEAETKPANEYGKSKEAGENVLRQSDGEWLLIRISWLCGQFGNNFVKTMLRLGSQRNELRIVDDQIGCPSLAFDVVEKSFQLLEKNSRGIFHISCEGKISWADFGGEIFRQSGLNVSVDRITSDQYPFTATRPMFTLLSNKKIAKTGLHPLPWKSGLSKLLKQVDKKNG